MTGQKFILPDVETVSMSGRAASLLIGSGCPEAALLYIYILKNNGVLPSDSAEKLHLSEDKLRLAVTTLSRLGLIKTDIADTGSSVSARQPVYAASDSAADNVEEAPKNSAHNLGNVADESQNPVKNIDDVGIASRARPAPADVLPDYSIADIKREMANGAQFSMLVDEVQRALGKILSSDDLIKLFGIYDCLRLPPEVILQLVTFCIAENRRRYGDHRLPTMRYIEKAAYTWEKEGIFSLEQAEEYIKNLAARRESTAQFAAALQIRGRDLTATERKYIESWIGMGFEPEAAAIAFDRTVTQTGRLVWKYMDSIMKNWHGKGLHRAKDIEKNDLRTDATGKPAQKNSTAPTAADIERMRKTLEKIKKG